MDDTQVLVRGNWRASTARHPYVGGGYLHDDNSGKGSRWAHFKTQLPRPGRYDVRLSYTADANRAPNVPVTIVHADGTTSLRIDERDEPPIDSLFVSLGTYSFQSGEMAEVRITNTGTDGCVVIDAVQWIPVQPSGVR